MAVNPYVSSAIVAGIACALVTPVLIKVALRWGIVDRPGHLKPHVRPTPYLGGVAIFVGLTVGVLMGPSPPVLVVPLGVALVLGLIDDARTLAPATRLVTEMLLGAGVAVVVGAVGPVRFLTVMLTTVVLVNAANFVDGADGLAASVCSVSFAGLAVLLSPSWTYLAVAAAAAGAGFLVYNRPPARVYLGDSGAYLLGTGLAILVGALMVESDLAGTPGYALAGTILAVVAYPVVEIVSTVIRRVAGRTPLFQGDREHLYDRMADRGFGPYVVLVMLSGVHLLAVLAAVLSGLLDAGWPGLVAGVGVIVAAWSASVYPPSQSATV